MTKTISFAQEGQTLRLTSDAPVQYSDEIAVEINLDTDYVQATDVVLITQPEGRHAKPARSTLTISGQVAQGTIKRRQLMQDGTTLFVLAGKIGDAVLPTAACCVQVQRSADPQAESYVDDPETLVDVISKAVAENGGLPSAGYDGTNDLGKIAVVDKSGNLAVRGVHLLIDEDTDGGALVLRGAVGQIIADIALSELREAVGGEEAEKVSNTKWSGYKYSDGRAIIKSTYTVTNKALSSQNGVYATSRLFGPSEMKMPSVFVEKPEMRSVFIPASSDTHIGAYPTYTKGDSETQSDNYYVYLPNTFLVCNDNTNTTLNGTVEFTAEGRWK